MTTSTCHYDRDHGTRITTNTDGDQIPCDRPHCAACGYRHLDPRDRAHPLTCPDCISTTRTDLDEIRWSCRHLRWHATRGGHDGRLLAAAPIPGGDALVLYARAGADGNDLTWSKHLDDDHHPDDVVPVLLPLAIWDTRLRTHHGHTPPARITVTTITSYLADQLTTYAQDPTGDWLSLATDLAALRRQLERVLHDETEPELGVSCFECGDRLVRRFGKPQPCRHRTPARDHLDHVRADAAAARDRLSVIATYPELGPPTYADRRAARRRPTAAEESAARRPCDACATSKAGQGGIEDPTVGQSWECLACRKQYTPGEYANAVRADLLRAGPDGDGWTYVTMAAEAASTQTGMPIAQGTVRKWAERGVVASCCRLVWAKVRGEVVVSPSPLRLVFWPDVADRAALLVERAGQLEAERAARAAEVARLRVLVENGHDPREAGKRMGLHPNRVRAIMDEWDAADQAS